MGALPAVEIVHLDFAAVSTVSSLVREGHSWRIAHAVHLARPSLEWPDGLPVLTSEPDAYAALKLVRTLRVPS
ncbi:hypothetical protein DVA86_21300 [Streptomyces armeniacus]|uniref:Uncharacterized protein n=1 Tax=Streptomyces armeniacus TaxID=83291 RepID=A0A345XT44_9ACTN|nr:hypothetical protein [Streptomyces armeniacus]AXK34810.1 hypothetical protein DVA86_21300 [Streptomyces armeniacus]